MHPESKEKRCEGGNEDVQLSTLDTSRENQENQTQLNFTAGIGTLDYTAIPLNDGDTEGKVLTPKEEFLKRIQNEDPLEGASWHFQNDVTVTRRKRKSQPFSPQQSTTQVSTVKSLYNIFQRMWIAGFCCTILEYKGFIFSDLTVQHTLTDSIGSHEIMITRNLSILGGMGF
jgi:hypothetical protein